MNWYIFHSIFILYIDLHKTRGRILLIWIIRNQLWNTRLFWFKFWIRSKCKHSISNQNKINHNLMTIQYPTFKTGQNCATTAWIEVPIGSTMTTDRYCGAFLNENDSATSSGVISSKIKFCQTFKRSFSFFLNIS